MESWDETKKQADNSEDKGFKPRESKIVSEMQEADLKKKLNDLKRLQEDVEDRIKEKEKNDSIKQLREQIRSSLRPFNREEPEQKVMISPVQKTDSEKIEVLKKDFDEKIEKMDREYKEVVRAVVGELQDLNKKKKRQDHIRTYANRSISFAEKAKGFIKNREMHRRILSYVFQLVLVVFLIFLLVNQISPLFFISYININMNWVIGAVILLGVLSVLYPPKDIVKVEKMKKRDYLFILTLGIAGGAIIKYKTGELGWLSWILSIISGAVIIIISILVLGESEEL